MNFLSNISFGEFQWTEIIYAMVGSFVGIFIPLWIDKRKSRKQEREAHKKIIASLNSELDSVREQILEYSAPEYQYDIFSFTTFVWDSIVSAGMLTDILSDDDMQGTLLMEIYAELSLLKELNEDFCHYNIQTDPETIELIYQNIKALRESIYNKIVAFQETNDKKVK